MSGGTGGFSQMTAILDLNSWEWHAPPASPYQPFPRSFAVASIVNETKMVYGLGNTIIIYLTALLQQH
jgi:hypothetical protein